ncbi:RDD family protein, partial [Cellulomonas sp. 179-A 4D5 NHS]|uniref:RDD family protein n=1 Tax=Cellulomonas sp. 179-A 4D5 NHS TaxID=3142378 RepID=UPI0039A0C780
MSTVPRVRAQPPATESLAGTGRRVLALLVDQLLALLLAAGASSIGYGIALDAVRSSTSDEVAPEVGAILALPLVVLAVCGIAQWVAEAFTGRTLGGLALGVRTVDADTGLTVGLLRIFVRNLVLGAGALVCGVGQFVVGASGAWDSAGRLQGWHDKVARTVVVRSGAGEPGAARAPRTEPARRAADLSAPRPTPTGEAPRRAAGSGGAESLMR